jgi:hypothetical protein
MRAVLALPPAMQSAHLVPALAALLFAAATLPSQCANVWLPGQPRQGPDGPVVALTRWDPDGPGPLAERLVVGGAFRTAGGTPANFVACWDEATSTWTAMPGLPFSASALLAMPNGDLYAGMPYPVGNDGVRRWNGTAWSAPLGGGMQPALVRALTALPNGDVVAGGSFGAAGGVVAEAVARWNGTAWSAMGTGLNGGVEALCTLPNGDVLAGGEFWPTGSSPAVAVRRWNGTAWSDLGSGANALRGRAQAIAVLPNGDVIAGGALQIGAGPSVPVARWDGTTWQGVGSGLVGPVKALVVMPNGDLLAGGWLSGLGSQPFGVARWDGIAWTPLGGVVDTRALLVLSNGDLAAGGSNAQFVGEGRYLARWNGSTWGPFGSGNDGLVQAIAPLHNGDVLVGGAFTSFGGVAANRIARRSGSTWSPLGAGIGDGQVRALTIRPNGDVVAAGTFLSAGGTPANRIASWNGTAWSPLAAGTNGPIACLAQLANGDVVAAGQFTSAGGVPANHVAKWDGTAWSPLGTGLTLPTGSIGATAAGVLANGDLVVGGTFTHAGGIAAANVARWDGAAWHAMGSGLPSGQGFTITSLLVRPGEIVASGSFLVAGNSVPIARWDGAAWSSLGASFANTRTALATLGNGDLVTGALERWNGTTWSPLAPASTLAGTWRSVFALATRANGNLLVGGTFTLVDGNVSAYFAELTTSCPATAIAFGSGCAGTAGPLTLAATNLPWLGGTFTTRATGMPAGSLALSILGTGTASLPLPSLVPQGLAGCFLLTTPDVLGAEIPTAGSVTTALAIPNVPTLAGQVFHQQVLPIEFAATGGMLTVASTNRLTLVIGAL